MVPCVPRITVSVSPLTAVTVITSCPIRIGNAYKGEAVGKPAVDATVIVVVVASGMAAVSVVGLRLGKPAEEATWMVVAVALETAAVSEEIRSTEAPLPCAAAVVPSWPRRRSRSRRRW